MTTEQQEALSIIKTACESVIADWPNHLKIQGAIQTIEAGLMPPEKPAKPTSDKP